MMPAKQQVCPQCGADRAAGLEIFNGLEQIKAAEISQSALSILQGGGNDKVILFHYFSIKSEIGCAERTLQ